MDDCCLELALSSELLSFPALDFLLVVAPPVLAEGLLLVRPE